jgi:alcohol dehydrogenase (cytochrome c)
VQSIEEQQDRLEDQKNTAPLWGVMSTAGGLVFYGTPEGFLKRRVDAPEPAGRAVEVQTGSGVV